MRQTKMAFTFYEFFAGGGMARLGLGSEWRCTFANEWCEKKAASYRAYFDGGELKIGDVANLRLEELPGVPTLVWASFPCQDLSLAGSGAGLGGDRSGTFRPFWKLVSEMISQGRIPKMVVLENVVGALSSRGGGDFTALMDCLAQAGYKGGALVLDASRFLPQSRPRLFIAAVHCPVRIPPGLFSTGPDEAWHTASVRSAYSRLPRLLRDMWVWWTLPWPDSPIPTLSEIIEEEPCSVKWHTSEQTARLVGLMSPLHLQKLDEAKRLGRRIAGTVYRRMRPGDEGRRVQRAEVRFDQISGCLRTPAGGSSRQIVIVVEGKRVRSRLLSPREAARLMGVPEDYPLPENYNVAYHLFGDGLAVPVVSWLERHLLRPLASSQAAKAA
ncbi:MAG TPA: DNA (cytosine-5-)-methyltransferase [Bryobacteraceae bacterium]|nr:DNA (cytosine-5-)-methyltransferase [Bryobacteraceae bacterium]